MKNLSHFAAQTSISFKYGSGLIKQHILSRVKRSNLWYGKPLTALHLQGQDALRKSAIIDTFNLGT